MDILVSILVFLAIGLGMCGIGFLFIFGVMCKDVGFKKAVEVMKYGVTTLD